MSVELGLSVFATIISLSGLVLHFVRFRKERPNLVIENVKCQHHPQSNVKKTAIRLAFTVHNRGDRSTQLNTLELPDYETSYKLGHPIEAHRSKTEDCYLKIPSSITYDQVHFSFVLHHTHGDKKIEASSEKTSKSLSNL